MIRENVFPDIFIKTQDDCARPRVKATFSPDLILFSTATFYNQSNQKVEVHLCVAQYVTEGLIRPRAERANFVTAY